MGGEVVHYYKKNLGDYAKRAGRLSMLQHGSYTLLIDSCYDREQFPTKDEAIEWTWASTKEEIEAVEFVLRKFFVLEGDRYVQPEIKADIDAYHEKAANNKRIAEEREARRNESSTKRARNVNEAPPNHKPITINQEPVTPPLSPTGERIEVKRVRGTRLPNQWGLDESHPSGLAADVLATAKALKVELQSDWTADTARYHFNEFRNHFLASSQRNAIKLDWLAAWRNWCSKAMREMPSADPVRRDRQAAAMRSAGAAA